MGQLSAKLRQGGLHAPSSLRCTMPDATMKLYLSMPCPSPAGGGGEGEGAPGYGRTVTWCPLRLALLTRFPSVPPVTHHVPRRDASSESRQSALTSITAAESRRVTSECYTGHICLVVDTLVIKTAVNRSAVQRGRPRANLVV